MDSSRVQRVIALLCGLGCYAWAGTEAETSRKKLERVTEIQGYSCDKGWAWFYADGHLGRCTVARDTRFGEAEAPAGSIIDLRPDGKPRDLMLVRNTSLLGYKCGGGGPLGPGEGSMTGFYPSGKLAVCWLAEDQEVQGVPCMKAAGFWGTLFHSGGQGVLFHENGKLKSCTLAKDFDGFRRGQRFVQGP